MSGPMVATFGIESVVLVSAQSVLAGAAEIAAGMDEAARAAADRKRQRKAERRARAATAAAMAMASDDAQRRQRIEELGRLVDELVPAEESALAARRQALAAGATGLNEQLAAYLARAGAAPADPQAARRLEVARILDRLDSGGDADLPPALVALARQVLAASGESRADALLTELRLQVQNHNAATAAAREEAARREAAAGVLEGVLEDLGYAVEDIGETLFVEGGVAHFQRPEWGDYFVRLRVDPRQGKLNFNVVRAGTTGEDRKREDMLAEERWCAAFPKLFDTLKARGIPITVTRLLQAGEAPVQVVDAASLPMRAAEERRAAPLKARSIG